jgi:N-carbamoylputrescine amidase
MRVTVTQLSDATPEAEWAALGEHCIESQSDLVLLPEMPFDHWLAATSQVDEARWQAAAFRHYKWLSRLGELGGAAVAGSRPVDAAGTPHNAAFTWSGDDGHASPHLKYYLPDELGFWEATWYRRAPQKSFRASLLAGSTVGFMICTDMWFTEHARSYGRQGVDLLLVPRATPAVSEAKWLAGGRTAAVAAGAFCLSANRQGVTEGVLFGGGGWIIDPDGNVLATTTEQQPFVTFEIDLAEAQAAKRTYPRYVLE